MRYQTNPWAYAKEQLGVWWTEDQRKIARAVLKHKRVLVKAAHGVGKTFLMGGLVNWYFDVFLDSITVTTAPTFPQVEKLLWGEIRSQRTLPPEAGVTQIKDPNNAKHYAVGRSPSKRAGRDEMGSQAFQGTHAEHLMVVFDEGAGVSDDRWAVVDGGLIVGTDNKFVAIGNPVVTSGPFFEAARDPRWHVIELSALNHPNIDAGLRGDPDVVPGAVSLAWLEDKLENPFWCELLGEPEDAEERKRWILAGAFEFPPMEDIWYQPGAEAEARILGRFPSNPTNTVWSSIWLDQAAERNYGWVPGEPWEIGVDVARYGDDATCVHTRRGMCSISHNTWRKMSTMETVGRIMNVVNSQGAFFPDDLPDRIILRIDTTGGDVGTGVADRLEEAIVDYGNIELHTIGAAERPYNMRKYQNKRSELWFNAATWGLSGELDISRLSARTRELLTAQLTASKYKYDSQSKRVVEPKKDVKERIGRSPDDADAFNLAWYTRGREYDQVAAHAAGDLQKKNVWKGPEDTLNWGGANNEQTRSWAVGTSARRRFSNE